VNDRDIETLLNSGRLPTRRRITLLLRLLPVRPTGRKELECPPAIERRTALAPGKASPPRRGWFYRAIVV